MVDQAEKITCIRAYQIAVGKLGIDPDYFLHKMTARALNEMLIGWNEKYEDEHYRWRVLTYYTAKPHFKIGDFENFYNISKAKKMKVEKSTKSRFEFITKLFGIDGGVDLNKHRHGIR